MSKELQLLPREGEPHLVQEELVRRLRSEFAFVETSHEKGRISMERSIAPRDRVDPSVFELAGALKGSGPGLKAAHVAALRAALAYALHEPRLPRMTAAAHARAHDVDRSKVVGARA